MTHKHYILISFFIFFVNTLTCTTVFALEKITLVGTVYSNKNKPIEGVDIQVFKLNKESESSKKVLTLVFKTTTNQEGKFYVDLTNKDNFEIYCSKEKWTSTTPQISVVTSEMQGNQKISIRQTMIKKNENPSIKINNTNYQSTSITYEIIDVKMGTSFIYQNNFEEFYFNVHHFGEYRVYASSPNYLSPFYQKLIIDNDKEYKLNLKFNEDKVNKFLTYPFEVNTDIITSSSKDELDQLISDLKKKPQYMIVISCHTDSRGDDLFNLKLSQKQANSLKLYLISQGISEKRIEAEGFGEKLLVNECKNNVKCSNLKHLENRRIEYRFKKWIDKS
ncbi:OmpA family protein [Flammeovirga pacifica]|uniref:OmpA-like domain-containing protein n=1 Tax=Flammeovirga pacifica TaxID=915059 RepID=A0A1S1YZV6_FLAPC|nr:OmpA family protein [Flammeovirga pacifica]OHX66544.1 hypothetical protein NH26_09330 [Flammeovirga pacifica]